MKSHWVYSVILTATLFLSCSGLLPRSHEATAKSQVTTIDLSSNAYAIYFDLDSLNCRTEGCASFNFTPRVPYSPTDRFRCELADTSCAYLELYDLLGNLRLIWEEDKLPPGQLELNFRDLRLESNVFFVRIRLNDGDFQRGLLLR